MKVNRICWSKKLSTQNTDNTLLSHQTVQCADQLIPNYQLYKPYNAMYTDIHFSLARPRKNRRAHDFVLERVVACMLSTKTVSG